MPIFKDITGQRFGRLTAVSLYSRATQHPRRNARWLCQCDCGSQATPTLINLTSGNTLSCGCLRRELFQTHGQTGTPEYHAWGAMIQRCTNPKDHRYKNYGARGITVCKQWQRSFKRFFADMGPRPEGLTLERIDNNIGYEPRNCTWDTYSQQNRNRRPKTHCVNGHAFDAANTYVNPKGHRICRACKRARWHRSENSRGDHQ